MFEAAVRLKLRFETPKGLLTTEDLWDLPLTAVNGKANLDDIARALSKKLKTDDVSFVNKTTKTDAATQLSFNVVKHVIDTLLAEKEARQNARAKSEQKEKILSLIADKENEELKGRSLDDLRKMVQDI